MKWCNCFVLIKYHFIYIFFIFNRRNEFPRDFYHLIVLVLMLKLQVIIAEDNLHEKERLKNVDVIWDG